MDTTLTFLGTGTSVGVPVIGCTCEVCTSDDPRNNRTRSSIHLQTPGLSLLVDFGPDLRQQALREGLTQVDEVLLSHGHLDHVAGFDELRAFCWHRETPLPIHSNRGSIEILQAMFPWAFEDHGYRGYIRPDPRIIDGPFTVADLAITPLRVDHGSVETHGFRFDLPSGQSVAYISDVKSIPDDTLPLLSGLDVLIIDCLRINPHATHMSVDESLAASRLVAAKQTFFTHLSHELDHEPTSAGLPDTILLATDGMKLLFQPDQHCAILPGPRSHS